MDKTNPFMPKSTNPFEDDVDDDTFLRQSTSRFGVSQCSKNPFDNDDAPGDKAVDAREDVELRTLASTEKSLAVLTETEAVGEGIAVELTEQREQLENCHRKIDDVNANLRNSQKHLKRIKSFFGGLKDFLMGVRIKPVKSAAPLSISKDASAQTSRRSRSTTVKQTASSHPGLVIRASDGDAARASVGDAARASVGDAARASVGDAARPQDVQSAIDQNLGHMFNHVVSLKGLAADLGQELDSQNELIDSLNDKTEEAQISLAKQNKDIAKLLK